MKYLLGIPFTNREDLLERALESVKAMWPYTVIADNSEAGLDPSAWPVEVVPSSVPLTFSQSMNLLQRWAAERSCDALIYMHNDAEAGPGTAERLLEIIEEAFITDPGWGVTFTLYDTMASLNMTAVGKVGAWDITLPQYYADNDYYRRIRLAGFGVIETGLPVIHANGGSSTIKSDSRRNFLNGVTFPLYHRYYVAKWGGPPGHELYDKPFKGAI